MSENRAPRNVGSVPSPSEWVAAIGSEKVHDERLPCRLVENLKSRLFFGTSMRQSFSRLEMSADRFHAGQFTSASTACVSLDVHDNGMPSGLHRTRHASKRQVGHTGYVESRVSQGLPAPAMDRARQICHSSMSDDVLFTTRTWR